MATDERAFVIDALSLEITASMWRILQEEIFNNPEKCIWGKSRKRVAHSKATPSYDKIHTITHPNKIWDFKNSIKSIFFSQQKGFDMSNDVDKCKERMPGIDTYRGCRYYDLKKLRKHWISENNPSEEEV